MDTASPPNVVSRQYYKPYGEVAQNYGTSTSTSLTSVGYTGQRLDGESGLMYYGARFYDPVLSSFVSADPTTSDLSNPLDYNKYLYARANPLRYIDTSGYGPEDYYVLVYGCSDPRNSNACQEQHGFGEYTKGFLRAQYSRWAAQQYRKYGEELPSWEEWSGTYIITVAAQDAYTGSRNLDKALGNIPQDGGDINLMGHSEGGGAILLYFIAKMAAERYPVQGVTGVDPRIASVALIDSELSAAAETAQTLGIDTADIAGWLSKRTRVPKGGVLQVSVTNSFVHSACISGFDCRVADYSKRGDNPTGNPGFDWPFDPVRRQWHNYSYRAFYSTNYEDWFYSYWR